MSSCQVAVVLGMAVSLVDGARTQMGQGTWPGLWGPTATASLCIGWWDPYTLGGLIGARWPCPVWSCSSLIPCRVVRPMVLSMGPAATRQVRLCVTISTCASSPQLRLPAQCGISCLHYCRIVNQ